MTRATPETLAVTTREASAWQGVALVTVGAICFSTAIIFIRWTKGLPTFTIAFYRALFAFLFLTLFTARIREPLHVRTYRPTIPLLVGLGLVVSVTVTLYTYAVQNTTAANAALLVNSAPIYVAVLAPWLLKERRARYTWPSLVLAVGGMVLISNPAQLDLRSSSFAGLAAAALSGVTYAISMMISRGVRGHVSGLTQALWTTGLVTLVLLPLALRTPPEAVLPNLPVLIPLGIFSLGLSYLFYFLGLSRIPVQVVSVVALMEPVAGILIGVLIFSEVPGPAGALGGGLVLASIYLISR